MEKKEISLFVKCPLCGQSLMDEAVLLGNKPSVKLNIQTADQRGVLHLCSIYGCTLKQINIPVKEAEVVEMYCPHCNKDLKISEKCPECEAPMVSLVIRAGGIVRICSRNGCASHHIVFKDVTDEMAKFYYEYGF